MNMYKTLMTFLRVIKLLHRMVRVSYKVRHQSSQRKACLKKRTIGGLAAFLFIFSLTSCDDFQPTDRKIHVGYILCNDHSCLSPEQYFSQSTLQAVGVVFAEQTEEHPLMAVMLQELNDVFCDSIGMSNGTSGSLTDFDGLSNTRAMQKSFNTGTKKGSPLAMTLYTFHANGQSDYLPSVAEQRLLNNSARIINPIMEKLEGTPIAFEGDSWYWTSTEVSDNSGFQAWLCSSVNGGIIETLKSERHKARAIVQIHYSN